MAVKLLLAPAAGGKTQAAIERIHALLAETPLSLVRVVVPDRNQAIRFEERLAARGAIGVRVGTFGDLYAEILAEAGKPFPVTPEPVIRRLIRAAIADASEHGELAHYASIQHRPGLLLVLADLFAELKRGRITPDLFSAATAGRGPRIEELATLYEKYQAHVVRLGWTDHEGLGWLAVNELETNAAAIEDFRLLVVDGFDSFNPTQVGLLKAVRQRVDEMLLTLTGDLSIQRSAHRRFTRALTTLRESLGPEVTVLPHQASPMPPLAHLEARLFEADSASEPAGDNVTFFEVQNLALEAREALRWLKARIVRDGIRPHECAVIAHDIRLYRQFLRDAAREFGLPLRLACGEPLASNPAIAALLNLMELPMRNWARRPLLDTLRSPYFDLTAFGLAPADAAGFDEIARAGRVIEGIDQWQEACSLAAGRDDSRVEDVPEDETEARGPIGAEAAAYWERLRALTLRLAPAPQGSFASYANWVEDLLSERTGLKFAARLAAQPDTAKRDEAAMKAFAAGLGALVLGESIVGQTGALGYDEFNAELRSVAEGSVYRLDDATNPRLGHIYASDVAAARGVSYRAVAILGLAEGLFPSPVLESPLISDEDRQNLTQVDALLEPRLRSDQQTLFYEATTRATEYLLLSRPYLAEDGEPWEPSPYWSAVSRLFQAPVHRIRTEDVRSHADAASAPELLEWCVRRRSLPAAYKELQDEWDFLRHSGAVLRSRLDGDAGGDDEGDGDLGPVLADRYGPSHIWSASRLETYAACPFQFFAKNVLQLDERKPPEPGFDTGQLGSMLHEVLELVYRQTPDPLSIDNLLATLAVIAEPVFDAAPRKHGFRATALWDTQRTELFDRLSRTLRALVEQAGQFRPMHFELRFGLDHERPLVVESPAGQVRFGGIIDRVDRDDTGRVRIIDYKTGSSWLTPKDLSEGRRLQLAIYAMAAERCLQLGEAVDGFYWAIQKGEASALRLQNFRYDSDDGQAYRGAAGATALAVEHIVTYLQGIRQGTFRPTIPAGGCKGYCPARLFCWHYQPAAW